MKAGFAVLSSLCLLVMIACLTVPARALDPGLSPAGKLFIKEAASINLMEITLGQVAHDKGSTQEVRDFGDHMVRDHSKANQELNAIAAQSNLKLPDQVELKHTLMVARLSKLSGSEFDRKYLQAMVQNHQKSVARFKKALKKVKDQALNAWTATTLPVLRQHLQMAKDVAQKLGPR